MDDHEIANVAAFKLRDTANRMMTLAEATGSRRLRARLLSLAKQFLEHERRLYELKHRARLNGEVTAPLADVMAAPAVARSAGERR